MTGYEFHKAKEDLKNFLKEIKNKPLGILSEEKLKKLIELEITVQGHGLSMDVKGERRRMAKLLAKTVTKVRKL